MSITVTYTTGSSSFSISMKLGSHLAVIDATRMTGNMFYINRVIVPVQIRNQGNGTLLMRRLAGFLDHMGMFAEIDATANYGSDVPRLIEFFKRFGFVELDDYKGHMARTPQCQTDTHI